ncbi:MAG: LysM peptidoglycan-binding protein [Sphingobacteriaceae bacterium]|nr:LysM peptidoglycan-binding protein [Sphingobacteriaceae bacterium]
MARMAGLAKYYFPLFDQGFKRYNVPEEIKFLSIVESALDPTVVSRTGAVGQWQFMPVTAFEYGLKIDNYVDERRDPVAASAAAANYLRNSYAEFGDWLLAIASYNCGKPAVSRAIQKAGFVRDFWAIRQYLPAETQNYVPAFIATVYMMNFYSKHNIVPTNSGLSLKNDVLQVENFVSLSNIAKAAKIGFQQLSALNPSYKGDIINGSVIAPKTLILPALAANAFDAVYEVLNGGQAKVAAAANSQSTSVELAYLPKKQ